MKVTETQLLIMMRVLEGSLKVADRTDMNIFGYNKETRLKTFDDLINQQGNEIIDVKDKTPEL